MGNLSAKLKEDFYAVLPPTIFFFVALHIVAFVRLLMMKQTNFQVTSTMSVTWPHFWAIRILLFVLILMYCTTRELVRVVGRDKVKRIFFGPLPAPLP